MPPSKPSISRKFADISRCSEILAIVIWALKARFSGSYPKGSTAFSTIPASSAVRSVPRRVRTKEYGPFSERDRLPRCPM